MLVKLFPKLNIKFIKLFNKFLRSPFYILLIGVLAVIAEVFSLEFIAFYPFLILGIIIPVLFSEDMTALIAPLLMVSIAVSYKTAQIEPTIVFGKNIVHFFIIFPLGSVLLITRFIYDLITHKERRRIFPHLTIGYAILLLAFLLGGVFSPYASLESSLFGLREIASLSLAYFYFLYTIDWSKFKKDYFGWLFLVYGLAISTELFVFLFRDMPTFDKSFVILGWGISNDIAGHLAMCIGPIGYLVITKKQRISWLFVLALSVILTSCILTDSRGGVIAIGLVSITTIILILIFAKKWTKIVTSILAALYVALFLLSFYVFKIDWLVDHCQSISRFWSDLFNTKPDSFDGFLSGRITIWKFGINQFFDHPILGVGWLQCDFPSADITFVYEARYHNTLVQVLAATGVIGFIGYIVHRIQACALAFKKPTLEKSMVFIGILGILIAGLVDCHMFNVWPAIAYSMMVAMIEGRNRAEI